MQSPFDFFHVRLVMNRHCFGPSAGLSPSQLEFTCGFPDGWRSTTTARIIQGQLYLRCTHNFEIRNSRDLKMPALMERELHRICRHTEAHAMKYWPSCWSAYRSGSPHRMSPVLRMLSRIATRKLGHALSPCATGRSLLRIMIETMAKTESSR